MIIKEILKFFISAIMLNETKFRGWLDYISKNFTFEYGNIYNGKARITAFLTAHTKLKFASPIDSGTASE